MIFHSEKRDKPLVFIAHAVGGNVGWNLICAAVWVRWAILEADVYAVAPYIGLCQALDDEVFTERELGMDVGHEVLRRCDEVWLCGREVTSGMTADEARAIANEIPVVDLTGQELP